jgi:two-component system sensor histidine kinase BaeS
MRRRFMWRIGCAMVLMIVVFGSLVALVAWLVSRAFDGTLALVATAVLPLVALFLVVLVVLRLVRRTAAPVSDLIEAAARVEGGDYAARVPERGPREVRSLARAFNAMSERLEGTDEARRRLLADVSHELRTPLTVMQGTLEGMLDGLYPVDDAHLVPVLEETRVLARLVEDLRTLSLSEAGNLRLHREPTDLGRLVNEVVAGHRPAADAAGIAMTVETSGLPTMDLDAARIRQVVGNLVANALRFTPPGGSVSVSGEASDSDASVIVRDTGTGMEADALEHAFDRFYRSSSSTGSGLGLPIARNLVEAHSGEISIESSPGSGTTVRFSFPLHRTDAEAGRS